MAEEEEEDETFQDKLSCCGRIKMVLWPFPYFSMAPVASRDCCLCCHESPNDDKLCVPPLIEIGGTWLSKSNPINIPFIIVRFILMCYVIYVAFFSFVLYVQDHHIMYYFFYFTQWNAIFVMLLMIAKFASSITVYYIAKDPKQYAVLDNDDIGDDDINLTGDILYDTRLETINEKGKIWKLYLFHKTLLMMELPALTMVVFNYWVFVYNGHYPSMTQELSSVQLHGLSCIALWIDYLISAERCYYKAILWPIILGTAYTIWSVFFELFIHFNESGDPYLYSSYDWSSGLTPIAFYFASAIIMSTFTAISAFIKNIILIASGIATFKVPAIPHSGFLDDIDL